MKRMSPFSSLLSMQPRTLLKTIRNHRDGRVLAKNAFWLSWIEIVNKIIPLITFPYITRVLGPELFGTYIFAQAVVVYFKLIIDFGFELSATKRVAENRDNRELLSSLFSEVTFIKTGLMLLCLASLLLLTLFPPFRSHRLLFILSFLYLISETFFPLWLFMGLEKMKTISIINLVVKLFFTAAIFIFINSPGHYLRLPLAYFGGSTIAALISQYIVLTQLKIFYRPVSLQSIKERFLESLHFFSSRIAVTFFGNSNTVMLGMVLGSTAVAFYACAEKIYNSLILLVRPVSDTLYPFMARTKNVALYKKLLSFLLAANSMLWIIVFFGSEYAVHLLFGAEYAPATGVLKILAIAGLVNIPSLLIGFPLLGAIGHKNIAIHSIIIASVTHLVLLVLLIPVLSVQAVAYLFLFTQSFIFILRLKGVIQKKVFR